MLKGILMATSDINVVNQSLNQGFRVIYLGDPISIQPEYRDVFTLASSLIPDYTAMSLYIDGNEQGFLNVYLASLNSRPAVEMLSVIFACLHKGFNVLFYVPEDAKGLNYIQYLLEFIRINYGIQTLTQSTEYYFDNNFRDRMISLLYLGNFVTPQEFLITCGNVDDITIRKLIMDLQPVVSDPTNMEEIVVWLKNFKNELLNSDKPLINGIQLAMEGNDNKCC